MEFSIPISKHNKLITKLYSDFTNVLVTKMNLSNKNDDTEYKIMCAHYIIMLDKLSNEIASHLEFHLDSLTGDSLTGQNYELFHNLSTNNKICLYLKFICRRYCTNVSPNINMTWNNYIRNVACNNMNNVVHPMSYEELNNQFKHLYINYTCVLITMLRAETDASYKPEYNIKRAEFAFMLNKLYSEFNARLNTNNPDGDENLKYKISTCTHLQTLLINHRSILPYNDQNIKDHADAWVKCVFENATCNTAQSTAQGGSGGENHDDTEHHDDLDELLKESLLGGAKSKARSKAKSKTTKATSASSVASKGSRKKGSRRKKRT